MIHIIVEIKGELKKKKDMNQNKLIFFFKKIF